MGPEVDVVVCAHNEEATIGPVLGAILGAPHLGRLIVVADECTDRTVELAFDALADVVVEVGHANKGSAMADGLRHVESDSVAFVDADLEGLRADHVEALLTAPPPWAMVVGIRDGYPRSLGALPSISGERRVPTRFALELPLAGSGWGAELGINAAAIKAGLPWVHLHMAGVFNPHRPKPDEYRQLAAGAVKHARHLVKYWARARRVR